MTSPSPRTWSLPGSSIDDVMVRVPLDREDPARGEIDVFARVVTADGGEDRPFLVYLQGGPGSEAPRPTTQTDAPAWMTRALRDHRLVLLDQRGTGRSAPVGADLPFPGADNGLTWRDATAQQQADALACFRADAIVKDAEAVREALGAQRWSVLGQSFGGFCTLRYRSAHPESLTATYFTGGIPALGHGIDEVYARTWQTMIDKSEAFYARFPGDRDRVRELMARARDGEIALPDGSLVSPRRLRGLGMALGAAGGAEKLHLLLELDHRAPAFRHDLAAALPFAGRNPLYAVVHESCWADGGTTRWAAERTMPDRVREDETLLAGEHVHREALTEDPELAPWAEAADLLAQREWPRLYDVDALRAAQVPGAAAVYHDDAYVPREFSLETAALLPGLRPWITSEYEHNGLRMDGERIVDRLFGLASGRLVR